MDCSDQRIAWDLRIHCDAHTLIGQRWIHHQLACIGQRDGERVQVLEGSQPRLLVLFLRLAKHLVQQHFEQFDGIVLSRGLQGVHERDQGGQSTRLGQAQHGGHFGLVGKARERGDPTGRDQHGGRNRNAEVAYRL